MTNYTKTTSYYLFWSLVSYCDPLQMNNKLSGYSKIASKLILDTKVLKLNIQLRIGFVTLQTAVRIGKSLEAFLNLNVKFMLLNIAGGLITSTALLENSIWKRIPGLRHQC